MAKGKKGKLFPTLSGLDKMLGLGKHSEEQDAAKETMVPTSVPSIGPTSSDIEIDVDVLGIVDVEVSVPVPGSSSATSFLTLTDTPDSYVSESNNFVVVNTTQTGLIFTSTVDGGSY